MEDEGKRVKFLYRPYTHGIPRQSTFNIALSSLVDAWVPSWRIKTRVKLLRLSTRVKQLHHRIGFFVDRPEISETESDVKLT